MPVQTVSLPDRGNAVTIDADEIQEVADLLRDIPAGQGVSFDEPQDSETKARSRAKLMKDALREDHGIEARGHAVVQGEGDDAVYLPTVSLNRSKS